MKAIFGKSPVISGAAIPPRSKSLTHRALICGALTNGARIKNILRCDDTLATLECLELLGARYRFEGNDIYIGGFDPFASRGETVLDCRDSGSTLRFLLPLALLSGDKTVFTGEPRLIGRVGYTFAPLCHEYAAESRSVTVSGGIVSDEYKLPADVSSQYVSGLMFALAAAGKRRVIHFSTAVESLPYIKMTSAVLSGFGVESEVSERGITVQSGRLFSAGEFDIEPDYSAAAALAAFNYIGGNVDIPGLGGASLQGDSVFPQVFCDVFAGKAVDLSDTPDLAPICFALAAFCGKGSFCGTRRLRYKESDRISSMSAELAKFGITADAEDNTVLLRGRLKEPSAPLCSHGDHRVVFALSLLCSHTGGVILNAEAVGKSFPGYFDILKGIGVDVALADE